MRRRSFLTASAAILIGCGRTSSRRLNVYNWADYIGKNTLAEFEREFGIEVRYGTYEVAEEMLAKVMSGNSGWDVVFPSNSFVRPMRDMGLLARLERARLPNAANLDSRFQSPPWDPQLVWSIPYMHGATGVVYSRKAPPVTGWADLWSAKYGGRMTMLDDQAEVFAACLKRMKCSVNAVEKGQLEAAKHMAVSQKPLLRAYINAEVRDQLVAGDVLASQAWSITAQQAIDQNGDLEFAYPAEGFAQYCDNAVILRESRRREQAHLFLDYLLRPQVAAEIALEMRTATANGAARALLPAKDRENTTLYPGAEVLARGEWFQDLPAAAQRLRDRLWTEIKAA